MNIVPIGDIDHEEKREITRSWINEKVSDFELILPRGDETEDDDEVTTLLKRKRKRLEELDRKYRERGDIEDLKKVIKEIDDILCAHPTALQPDC